jgi:hypothetical protein
VALPDGFAAGLRFQGLTSRPAVAIPLTEVIAAEAGRTLGLIPNTLRVLTVSGVERFVVWGRWAWVEAIEAARTKRAEPDAAADGGGM